MIGYNHWHMRVHIVPSFGSSNTFFLSTFPLSVSMILRRRALHLSHLDDVKSWMIPRLSQYFDAFLWMAPAKSISQRSNGFHIAPPPLYREIAMLVVIISAQAMVQALLAQGIIITSTVREAFQTSAADATWGSAVSICIGRKLQTFS